MPTHDNPAYVKEGDRAAKIIGERLAWDAGEPYSPKHLRMGRQALLTLKDHGYFVGRLVPWNAANAR